MPSREASLRNLAKARLSWRPPRPWRSRAESRVIRLFAWQWLLKHGPWCSGRALARWLGVSHTYVQKLTRALSRSERDFLCETQHSAPPTIDGLDRAREETRQQAKRGCLRTPSRWKVAECKFGDSLIRCEVPASTNLDSFAGVNLPPPGDINLGKPDYNAINMWHLRMNAEREKAKRSWRPAVRSWRSWSG